MATHLQMISIPSPVMSHLVLEWVAHELLLWRLVKVVMRLRRHPNVSVEVAVVVMVILVIVVELLFVVHALVVLQRH